MFCRKINRLSAGFVKFSRYSSSESSKQTKQSSQKATIDNAEIVHHGKLSDGWWEKMGKLRALHSFNPLRVGYVRDGLVDLGWKEPSASQPLQGLKIIDVGCGGGILSEPLARIGATVTGVDGSEELINTAREHAALDSTLSGRLTYVCTSIEDHAVEHSNTYDAVVASEVLEHVTNKDYFLKCCVDLLKVDGSIFITTINKTIASWLGSIILAEHVFRLVPNGTHEWDKFISPLDTQRLLEKHGCQVKTIRGTYYNPMTNDWGFIPSVVNNYALHAFKLPP